MRRLLFAVLLPFLASCVSSGPDPFLVDIQERTQKVETLLQGEKKAREKLARQVSALLDTAKTLREQLERETSLAASREQERKRDWSAGLARWEQDLASLAESTGKAFRALGLQVQSALAGLARLEKKWQESQKGREQAGRLAEENAKAARELADRVAALEKGLSSLEKGLTRASAERAGILARLAEMEKALEGMPSKFPKSPGRELFSGLQSRMERVERGLERLRTIWEEDVRGVLSGLSHSLRSWSGKTEDLAVRLDQLEEKVRKASFRRNGGATPPSTRKAPHPFPASRPFRLAPARAKAAGGPIAKVGPPVALQETGKNPWDAVTGLGARTWPWLVGMGALLFFLLAWALKGGEAPAEKEEEGEEEGKRGHGRGASGQDEPADRVGGASLRASRKGPAGEAALVSSPFAAQRNASPGEELPPARVLAELPLEKEGEDREVRVRKALEILESSALCLADPEVQVETDQAGGKIRIFFWAPGFAPSEEIQELASRLESL